MGCCCHIPHDRMLRKSQRLRTKREFAEVFERGRSVANRELVLYSLRVGRARDDVKVGFSVSGRLGGAVVRNRVKRRLRAAVGSLLPLVRGGYHLVLIARQPSRDVRYERLYEATADLLRRSQLLLAEPAPQDDQGGEDADR